MKKWLWSIVVVCVVAWSAGPTLAAGLNDFKILKIAPKDHRAVVKTPEGKLQLVRVGDVLAEGAKVVEIAAGRVVLTRQDSQGPETVIVRLGDQGQRLERYRTNPPAASNLTAPLVGTGEAAQAPSAAVGQ